MPFGTSEALPEAKVDDLSLRKWRLTTKDVDWELKRVFAGRDYVLHLKYAGTKGGSLYLNEYSLFHPLGAWLPPGVGLRAKAVELDVRPGPGCGGGNVQVWLQTRQAKCLAGEAFSKRTPVDLKGMTPDAWTPLSVPVGLVPDNRLADIALIVTGNAAKAPCEFFVANVRVVCADGTAYEVVNARAPSYLDGFAAKPPDRFRPLPTRPLVQLGVGAWPPVVGRADFPRIGEWGRRYCPEFDVVLSVGGSLEPVYRTLHEQLPDNVFLQYQKSQHAFQYPALFDALPRNEFGVAQNFFFNSIVATHPIIRRALDEQLAYGAALGFSNFQTYDYVWAYKDALWGYDEACVAAFREDLIGIGEKLALTDGRVIGFADYFRAYHGNDPQPGDYGYAGWDEFVPEPKTAYAAEGDLGARRYELFAMLRNYEWLLQAQRWNDRAADWGGRHDYLLNGESWENANDHLFLLKLKNTGIVSPEFFSMTPKAIERLYHSLGEFVREAKRNGKRFGMTVETSRGGANGQPYWSPKTAFAICYALAGLGLDSFEYDHIPACTIWSEDTLRRQWGGDGRAAYSRMTERHLLGNVRGYRRAMLDGVRRPDRTDVLVLVRRPVSRDADGAPWCPRLTELGCDFAVTDIVELPELLPGARVVFAGDEAKRPCVKAQLDAWVAKGGTLITDPKRADLPALAEGLKLPRVQLDKTAASAIALRFAGKGFESAVLIDRKAVDAADRAKWYNEKWGPTFGKGQFDPANYLYFDACPGNVCRATFAVPSDGPYLVYRYLEDRTETAEVTDGRLTLDNSGRFCEVCYFAPDTAAFRRKIDELRADRALTGEAFKEK